MNDAKFTWRERASKSELVASMWTCDVLEATTRTALADPCISIILVKSDSTSEVLLRGPETKPRSELLIPGYTWTAIRLQPGTLLRDFPAQEFVNRSLILPTDALSRFKLGGTRWQFPGFGDAELLVDELHKKGYLSYDPSGQKCPPQGLSSRSYSRLVKRTTGLSPYKLHQLKRIHQALLLLKEGVPAVTVATELDFVDQAHLAHATKQFLGHTPKELLDLPQAP